MTWLSGLVVEIQSTLHSAKLPAPLLDGRELPTPWDHPVTDSSPSLGPRQREPRAVRGAGPLRCLVARGLWLLSPGLLAPGSQYRPRPHSIYLSGLVCLPFQGLAFKGVSGARQTSKVEIAAVRRKLDSLPGRGRRKYDAKKHRAENSTTRVHSARLSRLHRLNPSRHHAPSAPAGRENRGAAISVCASCCIKGGMEALMGPDE